MVPGKRLGSRGNRRSGAGEDVGTRHPGVWYSCAVDTVFVIEGGGRVEDRWGETVKGKRGVYACMGALPL